MNKKSQQVNSIYSKGFTLTEIVVVMVLLGLIIILATSITLIVNHSQQITQIDSKGEGEIVKVKAAFDDWMLIYDSHIYVLEISEDKHRIDVIEVDESESSDSEGGEADEDKNEPNADEGESDEPTNPNMRFQDGAFIYKENIGYDPTESVPETSIRLTSMLDITFEFYQNESTENGILALIAHFEKTDYKMLYYVRATSIRQKTGE